ncbi:hypothetical protein C7S18_08060 [Ahniella affigens]|uniref:ABC transporter permease n=1 Tax=Ahniella affigens TaxID=2021234 RepID=A0A2P1PQN7_9GAMM|nr:FtsX-like permease family protein [Ahniella affigens]AVP97149.1 hypothetical protein C7S18_08060 [Ahniella affigens]
MNELPVILRALLRNRSSALLTVFQVALTLAVLVNVFAASDGYRAAIAQPMGIPESELLALTNEWFDSEGQAPATGAEALHRDRILRDMDLLKQIPGVREVSVTNGFPLSDAAPVRAVRLERDSETALSGTFYIGDRSFLKTLGLELVSGRDFSDAEIQWSSDPNLSEGAPVVIIAQALSDKLFPDGNALNQQITIGDRLLTIVGVVKRLPGLHPLWSNVEMSMIVPGVRAQPMSRYLLRVDPMQLDEVAMLAEQRLYEANPESMITVEGLVEIKKRTLSVAMSTVTVLTAVCVLLLLVTALGCYGQTTFTVAKRTREIGVRRAIGSTKTQVVTNFLIENWLMTTAGLIVGVLLTYMLNIVLVQGLGAAKVDFSMIAPGIVFLWVLGLFAAFLPSLRASRVPPALATRSA